MNKLDILKNFIDNNNGMITTADLKKLNIHRQYLKMLCDKQYLERVQRGIYVKVELFANDFYVFQNKYKSGVFSHQTALKLYGILDRLPLQYDLTFLNNVRINNKFIHAHYVNKERFKVGLIEMKLEDGTIVRTYNLERTMIDIIRDRNKIETQVFDLIIKEYVNRKDKNLIKLIDYAKIFCIDKIVGKYIKIKNS